MGGTLDDPVEGFGDEQRDGYAERALHWHRWMATESEREGDDDGNVHEVRLNDRDPAHCTERQVSVFATAPHTRGSATAFAVDNHAEREGE